MGSCSSEPKDKKAYAREVGEILVKNHGKKKFYSPEQIKRASAQSRQNVDWHCWAMCLYAAPADFAAYHRKTGEACDYTAMKTEMASALTDGASDSWLDLDLSWLEWPEIDLSSIFDFLD